MNTDYILYLDLDGVLSDFDRGTEELPEGEMGYLTAGEDWWINLEWMPGGIEVWRVASSLFKDIHILSSLGIGSGREWRRMGEVIDAGKRGWILKNLTPHIPETKIHTVQESHLKSQFASENSILVDDRDDTIEDWNDAGGIGIHHNANYYKSTVAELKILAEGHDSLSKLVKRP